MSHKFANFCQKKPGYEVVLYMDTIFKISSGTPLLLPDSRMSDPPPPPPYIEKAA